MRKTKKVPLLKESNRLSESRKDWSVLAARAFGRIIDIFNHKMDLYMSYNEKDDINCSLNILGKLDLKEVLKYRIHRSELGYEASNGKFYMPSITDFLNTFLHLQDHKILIGDIYKKEHVKSIKLVGSVEYNPDFDVITCYQDLGAIDYLLGLKESYTPINPYIAMCFQSKYTWRFYEWCCQWRKTGHFSLSIKEIKYRLKIDAYIEEETKIEHKEKYPLFRDFEKNVIKPAHSELKKLFEEGVSDVCFDYEIIYDRTRPGRKRATDLDFKIIRHEKPKESSKPKALSPTLFEDYNTKLLHLRDDILIPLFSSSYDRDWPIRAIVKLGNKSDMKLVNDVYSQIQGIIAKYNAGKIKNAPAVIRKYFKNDLGIDVDLKNYKKS